MCCYLYPMGRRTPLTEELLTYDVDVSWWVTHAVEPAQPPAQALPRSGRASSLRPVIDIAATVYPTSGSRRDGGVESSAGLSARTSSSMKITSDLAVGDDVEHGSPVLVVPTTYADSEVNPLVG